MYFTYTLIYDSISREQVKESYTLDLDTGKIEITEKPGKEKRKGEKVKKGLLAPENIKKHISKAKREKLYKT